MAFLLSFITLLIVCFSVLYLWAKKNYRLWSNCKIPYLEPVFPFGNFAESIREIHFGKLSRNLYEKSKSFGDYCGIFIFFKPTLLITNPEFIKTILVRDFNYFPDRGVYYNKKHDPLSANIFFLEGAEWKSLRQKLTPAFTSGKMRMMFHTITAVADELKKYIDGNNVVGTDVDMKDLMARFTTDVISSCVFGLEGNSIEDPNSEFRQVGRKVMSFSKIKGFKTFLAMAFRDLARQVGFRTFDEESTKFFIDMVHKTIGFRKENNIHRNDLMQIMIELMRQNYESDEGLTVDELAANSFMFFFAGFDTSSTTLTFALFELARHPDVQEAARKEIKRVLEKHDNQITYEGVGEMELLDRIILETLRYYPTVSTLHRISIKPYEMPNGSTIPEGTAIIVPVLGIHHDKDIYEDPEKFDPERFTEENKASRHPYAFIPFGEGPRVCIGQRFAMLQMKVCLITLLKHYSVELTEKSEIPIKIDEIAMTYVPKGSVWLKLNKI